MQNLIDDLRSCRDNRLTEITVRKLSHIFDVLRREAGIRVEAKNRRGLLLRFLIRQILLVHQELDVHIHRVTWHQAD